MENRINRNRYCTASTYQCKVATQLTANRESRIVPIPGELSVNCRRGNASQDDLLSALSASLRCPLSGVEVSLQRGDAESAERMKVKSVAQKDVLQPLSSATSAKSAVQSPAGSIEPRIARISRIGHSDFDIRHLVLAGSTLPPLIFRESRATITGSASHRTLSGVTGLVIGIDRPF